MTETIDTILSRWFGEESSAATIAADRKKLWWGKDETVDEEIKDRFRETVEAVAEGEVNHWRDSADGLLASIICTDQFPRNMFRGDPRAFQYDELALELAHQAVATSEDQNLAPIQRVFVYMPFEHAESLEMQNEAVRLFTELESAVDESERELFQGYTQFAHRHQEIIERFGRFPHRNEILGRSTTNEEAEFLKQPGSSF